MIINMLNAWSVKDALREATVKGMAYSLGYASLETELMLLRLRKQPVALLQVGTDMVYCHCIRELKRTLDTVRKESITIEFLECETDRVPTLSTSDFRAITSPRDRETLEERTWGYASETGAKFQISEFLDNLELQAAC